MPRSPWEIVLWVLVVVFPWLLVRAGRRRDLAFLAVMWGILCASAQVLANPAGERHEAVIAFCVLLTFDLAAWFMPETVEAQACSSLPGARPPRCCWFRLRSGLFRRHASSEAAGCSRIGMCSNIIRRSRPSGGLGMMTGGWRRSPAMRIASQTRSCSGGR